MDQKPGKLFLGGLINPADGARTGDDLIYPSDDLTTHGVIVGMTGSGKTGLGVDLIEEALISGIPALIIDPKGDMGNLLLNFPDFRPEDFAPWVDEAEAEREGVDVPTFAANTALTWSRGLTDWNISPERMRLVRNRSTIYTPGSSAGTRINLLGSLDAPPGSFDDDAESLRDEIESYVSSLLTVAGVTADPISSPEHILTATIIEDAWRNGRSLDLASLIGAIQDPPFRKLGVFELDRFFAPKDRTALAMKLNGLVASPSFAGWLDGIPLDIEGLLTRDGQPQAAIIYLAHLNDTERQFVVTLVLAKLVSWMRRQSGTSRLRALVYMDEVFGFCPPTAEPPSKKPILTILKQARAYGVGMVLSTQNPVDLDYKAMSNAGTWMIGRLQTERDKARILEALKSAAGGVQVSDFDRLISGLGKRQFVLSAAKKSQPSLFTTRWTMSYLAGPLTKEEVRRLRLENPTTQPAESTAPPVPVLGPVASDDATSVSPRPHDSVAVSFCDSAAPWLATVGGDPNGSKLAAGAVATVGLTYDDTAASLIHQEVFEAIVFPLGPDFDPESVFAVDHDPRDFKPSPVKVLPFTIPDAKIDTKACWTNLGTALGDHLVSTRKLEIGKNPDLKLYSRVGESEADFIARCEAAADNAADNETAKLRLTYEARIERVKSAVAAADRRVRELEVDVRGDKHTEILSTAGDLLGAFLGGRSTTRALSRAASRRSQTRSTQQRLETVNEKVGEKQAELETLEDELADKIAEIADKWEAVGSQIETIEIGLERIDVKVAPLGLVWIPLV